jgi:hypothetical protein
MRDGAEVIASGCWTDDHGASQNKLDARSHARASHIQQTTSCDILLTALTRQRGNLQLQRSTFNVSTLTGLILTLQHCPPSRELLPFFIQNRLINCFPTGGSGPGHPLATPLLCVAASPLPCIALLPSSVAAGLSWCFRKNAIAPSINSIKLRKYWSG